MSEIKKVSPYTHARIRTEMYLGSRSPHEQAIITYDEKLNPILKNQTWVPALYCAVRELIDNACDEVIGHKHGTSIWIEWDEKNSIVSVEDNGRGIPIDLDKVSGEYAATMAVSQTLTGRNFDTRGEVAGTNGVGSAIVNFCSEWFELDVRRDGKRFQQRFEQCHEWLEEQELQINKPKITKITSIATGTKVIAKLSKHVFETIPNIKKNMLLPKEFVRARVVELAMANPQTKFYFNGQKILIKLSKGIPHNLSDLNPFLLSLKTTRMDSQYFLMTDWPHEDPIQHSIVNNIPAFHGGSHMEAFRKTFFKSLLGALSKESKRRGLQPNISDCEAHVCIFNITKMQAPDFDSQSKTRLINEWVGTETRKWLEAEDLYKNLIKKNPEWIDRIFERCAARTKIKDDKDVKGLNKRLLRAKVPRLIDCSGKDRSKCSLFLCEGQSAVGGMASARNPELHAGLGLKGKVLNAFDCSIKEILENKELADIINAVGLTIGQPIKRESLRYGKIYLASDMDPDGANIAALLVNFFYKCWPTLFDPALPPFIYIFMTPFIIAEKGKQRKYWHAHNYDTFKSEDYKGWAITRAKGLGTLNKEDWEFALQTPVAIPVIDDGNMPQLMSLLFDSKLADRRKDWMSI